MVSEPDILIEWIQYYLLLPKIAKSRNQVKFESAKGPMVVTRLPGGKIKVDKKPSAPMTGLPADADEPDHFESMWRKRLISLVMSKYGDMALTSLRSVWEEEAMHADRPRKWQYYDNEQSREDYDKKQRFKVFIKTFMRKHGELTLKQAWPLVPEEYKSIMLGRFMLHGLIPKASIPIGVELEPEKFKTARTRTPDPQRRAAWWYNNDQPFRTPVYGEPYDAWKQRIAPRPGETYAQYKARLDAPPERE